MPLAGRQLDQGSAGLRALCPSTGFVWQRSRTVLAGTGGGRILTDDPERPTWAALQEFSGDGVLFLSGALDRELVARLIQRLRRDHTVTVGLTEGDPLRGLLPDPDLERQRIVFADRDRRVELRESSGEPVGFRLAPIDEALLPGCLWPPWLSADDAAALAHGLGYCLLDGAVVVAEAFAGPLLDGELEMATIPVPAIGGEGWRPSSAPAPFWSASAGATGPGGTPTPITSAR